GFTVVDRAVIAAMACTSPQVPLDGEGVAMIFRNGVNHEGVYVGEDMNFFRDARTRGFPVWCDPSIELGHVGRKEWRGRLRDALQRKPSEEVVCLG
ncbi:MAG TPA: hypothetical protein VFJ52_04570, partial [Terriglobia bacterium]|nr:hypothetical protein [Terriglobia bacterium]